MTILYSFFFFFFFFFNDTATTEIYTLSLHDALPISITTSVVAAPIRTGLAAIEAERRRLIARSPRSEEHTSELHHSSISYAVFCLKKKKKTDLSTRNQSTTYIYQRSLQ